jgi:hypothetical protein
MFIESLPSNGSVRHIIIIIIIITIINFIENNRPWEANSRWAIQEICRIL